MANNSRLLVLILLIPFLISCKKEESEDKAPTVIINNPTEGQAFNVLDIFTVNADISDDNGVKLVTVGLLNSQFIQVQTAVSVNVSSETELSFSKSYQLYDIRLESGTYYIWVNAYDGINQTNAYQRIDVTAVPKKLTGIYAIAKNTSLQTSIYKIDSAYGHSSLTSFTSDYGGSSISSYEQLLFVSGKNTGDTKAINTNNGSVRWAVPFPFGSAPHCMENYHADKITYTSYRAGTINGYTFNELNVFSANALSGYYPEKFFKLGNFFLSEQKPLTIGSKKLVTYVSTAQPIQEQLLPIDDVVEIFRKESTKAFVLGNNSSQQAGMEIFDINGNSFWSPRTMPAAKLLSAEQVDSNTYLIGLDNNTIYKYTYHNNSLISHISGIKPKSIKYNAVDGEIIIADDTKVYSYDYSTAAFKNSATLPDTIYNIHLLFNR